MMRLWGLSLFILLGIALSAEAEVINVTATRTSFNATWDEVDLHIISFTGIPDSWLCSYLMATWTANGGTFNLPGGGTWYNTIRDGGDLTPGQPAPCTYINMLNLMPGTPARYKADGTAGGNTTSRSFYVGESMHPTGADGILVFGLGPTDYTPGDSLYWNDWDAEWEQYPGYGFDNTLLGTFYVSKSTQWTPGQTVFDGSASFAPYWGGSGETVPITVQIVPEPSTLALLCCALLALLAYAWRKRK